MSQSVQRSSWCAASIAGAALVAIACAPAPGGEPRAARASRALVPDAATALRPFDSARIASMDVTLEGTAIGVGPFDLTFEWHAEASPLLLHTATATAAYAGFPASVVIQVPAPGTYWWRVKSASDSAIASELRSFTVDPARTGTDWFQTTAAQFAAYARPDVLVRNRSGGELALGYGPAVFRDDFEAGLGKWTPRTFVSTPDATTGVSTTSTQYVSPMQSMMMRDGSATNAARAESMPLTVPLLGHIGFNLKSDGDAAKLWGAYYRGRNYASTFGIGLEAGSIAYTAGAAGWQPLAPFVPGAWHRFDVEYDVSTAVYNLEVGGQTPVIGVPFDSPSSFASLLLENTGPPRVDLLTPALTGTSYWDDVSLEPLATTAQVVSAPIDFGDAPAGSTAWGALTWNAIVPAGTTMGVSVEGFDGLDWVGVSALAPLNGAGDLPVAAPPHSLAGIDPATYRMLRLRAGLTRTGLASPQLLDWSVAWQIAPPGLSLQKTFGDSQVAEVGQPLPQWLVVRVTDEQGYGMPGQTVYFQALSGGGSISPSASTDASGFARGMATVGPDPGPNVFRASLSNGAWVEFTATAVPAVQPPATLRFVSPPVSVVAGAPFDLVVEVLDSAGVRAAQSSLDVVLALVENPAGGTLNGTLSQAAVAGLATFSGLSLEPAGSYVVAASSAALSFAAMATLDVRPAAPSSVRLVVSTAHAAACEPITAVVQLVDGLGHPVQQPATVTVCAEPATLARATATTLGTPVLSGSCATGMLDAAGQGSVTWVANTAGTAALLVTELNGAPQTGVAAVAAEWTAPTVGAASVLGLGSREGDDLHLALGQTVAVYVSVSDSCGRPLDLAPGEVSVHVGASFQIGPAEVDAASPGLVRVPLTLVDCPADPAVPLAIRADVRGTPLLDSTGAPLERRVFADCIPARLELTLVTDPPSLEVVSGAVVRVVATLLNPSDQPLDAIQLAFEPAGLVPLDPAPAVFALSAGGAKEVGLRALVSPGGARIASLKAVAAGASGEPHAEFALTLQVAPPDVSMGGCGCSAAAAPPVWAAGVALALAARRRRGR